MMNSFFCAKANRSRVKAIIVACLIPWQLQGADANSPKSAKEPANPESLTGDSTSTRDPLMVEADAIGEEVSQDQEKSSDEVLEPESEDSSSEDLDEDMDSEEELDWDEILGSEDESEDEGELSEWRGGNTEFTGWLNLSTGGVDVRGNQAEFRRRMGRPSNGFGGIDDLHFEKWVGENGLFIMDAKARFGDEDYDFSLKYTDSEIGEIAGGYRESRTFYNGSGGYDPTTDTWFPLEQDELFIDRGMAWVSGQMTIESWPEFTFDYAHSFTKGNKDSLIWAPAIAAQGRAISSSFRNIDESQDRVSLGARHTIGHTELGAGVRIESGSRSNSLNQRVDPESPSESHLTQQHATDTDLFGAHTYTETRFNERWFFSSGYAITSLDTDFRGNRIFALEYDAVYDPSLARGPGFLGLTGGSRVNQHVATLNLMYQPWKKFTITPSVRIEHQDMEGRSTWLDTPSSNAFRQGLSEQGFIDLSERLEVRYTGLKEWVFYLRGDWLQGDGDLEERQLALTSGLVDFERDTDFSRFQHKYTAGANWYPIQRLSLGAQYYRKSRSNDFEHVTDSIDNIGLNRYPAYINRYNFDLDDVNFRVTVRPHTSLTLVSRFDYQQSDISLRADGLSSLDAAEQNAYIISQSATWSPWSRVYLQGNFNYVLDKTTTPVNQAPALNALVQNARNDYWTASGIIGYLIDARTEIEAQYQYFRSNNYTDNSAFTQPYGADDTDHGVTVSLTRRIRENMRWNLSYGFFKHQSDTYGGRNDYEAHLVSTGLQYRF
jgi:hypothetical protein